MSVSYSRPVSSGSARTHSIRLHFSQAARPKIVVTYLGYHNELEFICYAFMLDARNASPFNWCNVPEWPLGFGIYSIHFYLNFNFLYSCSHKTLT